MTDDTQKQNPTQASSDESKPDAELSEKDLKQVAGGAVNAFLTIQGVPGESTSDKPKDWIEILSFQNDVIKP